MQIPQEIRSDEMRIAVLGAGAMGCLYGGCLARSGNEVVFVDVVQKCIETINSQGITLVQNGKSFVIHATAGKAEDIQGPFDLLILFTKTIHSEKALESVRHILSENTMVLSLQNGLGNEEIIAKYVPRSHILIGMTGYPADTKGPGQVESNGSSFTKLMRADGVQTQRVADIADAITNAGLNCSVDEDVYVAIWEKAIFNAAVNALCAVTRMTVGQIADYGGEKLTFEVVREGISVANAQGIHADKNRVDNMLRHAFAKHHDHKPSMLQDILAGRKTEAAFINGAIVKAAEKAGMTAPINATLAQLVQLIESCPDAD